MRLLRRQTSSPNPLSTPTAETDLGSCAISPFYGVFEGMWFYTWFRADAVVRNKMIGSDEQYQYETGSSLTW